MAQVRINELRCALCLNYLSCTPVRVLEDGNTICSRCAPPNNRPAYRNSILEKILSVIKFPCRFANYGCNQLVLFDQASRHEADCTFCTFLCPCLPKGSCYWRGSMLQIFNHFTEKHSNSIRKDMEFQFQLNQNTEEVSVAQIDGISFIFKFVYAVATRTFLYEVRYLDFIVNKAYFNMRIMSNQYGFHSKGDCFLYVGDFRDEENSCLGKLLLDDSVLKLLNNPTFLNVVMNVSVTRRVITQQLSKLDDVLESMQRKKYSCNWQGCDFVGKSDTIQQHEQSCQFRIYKCPVSRCKTTYKFEKAINHFIMCHREYEYYTGKFDYRPTISKKRASQCIYALKSNEIITVLCKNYINTVKKSVDHRIRFNISGNNSVMGYVQYLHEHRQIKSQPYKVVSRERYRVCPNRSYSMTSFKLQDRLTVSIDHIIVMPK